MEYKISEENEDPKQSVIEKAGVLVHFTLADVERDRAINAKSRKEVAAKRDFEFAVTQNIEQHHPEILELDDETLLRVWMYQEAKGKIKVCDEKLAEFDKNEDELIVELEDISNQLPELSTSINVHAKEVA